MLAAIAQSAIGIVLDDQQVVLMGDVDELFAPFERQGAARWVLEVRDDVEKAEVFFGRQLRHGFGDHPVVVGGYGLKRA